MGDVLMGPLYFSNCMVHNHLVNVFSAATIS